MRVFRVIMLGEKGAKGIHRIETVYFDREISRGAAGEAERRG
jgi:hypothetical protein